MILMLSSAVLAALTPLIGDPANESLAAPATAAMTPVYTELSDTANTQTRQVLTATTRVQAECLHLELWDRPASSLSDDRNNAPPSDRCACTVNTTIH